MIIQPQDITTLCRFTDMDDEDLSRFIETAENVDLKIQLGCELLDKIQAHPEEYAKLLDGGRYEDKDGTIFTFSGLKKALAFYAYSRAAKQGTEILTRTGLVDKLNDYSQKSDQKNREIVAKETRDVADYYMREVLQYCKHKGYISEDAKPIRRKNIYRVIGED